MKSLPRPAAAAALLVSSLLGSAQAQDRYDAPMLGPPANEPQVRFNETYYYPDTNLPPAIELPTARAGVTTLAGAPRRITPIQAAPRLHDYGSKHAQKAAPTGKGHSSIKKHTQHSSKLDWLRPAPKRHAKGKSHGKGKSSCAFRGDCWYAGAYGLLMTRDQEDHYRFSFDTANEAIQLTDSRDADMGWSGGVEFRGGKYFDCGTKAVEFVYWGLYPDSDVTVTTSDAVAGSLNGILNWDQLDYNGASADTAVDNAEAHAIFRDMEVHNVEYNFLKFCGYCSGGPCDCSRLRYHWLAGVRYFKLDDELSFAADTVNRQFTGAVEELYYDINLDNNLIGFQVGGEGEYALSDRVNFDFGLKVGLYANYIEHRSEIRGAAGRAVVNNGPNLGTEFFVDNSKDDLSMLGELTLGLEYRLSDRWTATAGYRAVAVAGLALPTDQIYPDLRGLQDVVLIDSNGSLILHGGYFGAEYNF